MFQEILYQDPLQLFALFADQSGAVFLDSAEMMSGCGRYSFIAFDPFLTLVSKNGKIQLGDKQFYGDPFEILKQTLSQFPAENRADLPPFQGGVVGYFGYGLVQHLEKLPSSSLDDMQFADMALGFYDVVLSFDQEQKRAWIFSSGYPLQASVERTKRAKERLNFALNQIANVPLSPLMQISSGENQIVSNFNQETYQRAVSQVINYILAGDIFQANISQRFRLDLAANIVPFELYRKLRALNPAPFAAYLNLADCIIASASPERFLRLAQLHIETRPIKGTRRRGKNKVEDQELAQALLASAKDRAENIMIVDLMRNDLSRVCEAHSVHVAKLCGLESYATVHHLVSVVTGKLRVDLNAIDLLRATFPGGSVTGAPKIRAMEIIAEIEPTERGPYCGSIGYIGFNGDMDCSITIRTLTIKNQVVTFQAGGAIVADSDPLEEYKETLTKASALQKTLYDFTNR
jgi:para-aminobenzoate synthetase component 1